MRIAKSRRDSLDIVSAGGELVRVVPLALVQERDAVSHELVHAVVAGAGAHLRHGRRRVDDHLFDKALARTVLVVHAVVGLEHNII